MTPKKQRRQADHQADHQADRTVRHSRPSNDAERPGPPPTRPSVKRPAPQRAERWRTWWSIPLIAALLATWLVAGDRAKALADEASEAKGCVDKVAATKADTSTTARDERAKACDGMSPGPRGQFCWVGASVQFFREWAHPLKNPWKQPNWARTELWYSPTCHTNWAVVESNSKQKFQAKVTRFKGDGQSVKYDGKEGLFTGTTWVPDGDINKSTPDTHDDAVQLDPKGFPTDDIMTSISNMVYAIDRPTWASARLIKDSDLFDPITTTAWA